VATLVDNPKGQVGRPSRSFTLEQSLALLEAARESRLNAYVVLSLATGIRTEEARELHWDHVGLVFASAIGTPLDAANVRREFRQITEAAGLGLGWAPRDLRHTFVSLMSADGVPIEEIARLAGHNRTATTELVYATNCALSSSQAPK
jgi:integrase